MNTPANRRAADAAPAGKNRGAADRHHAPTSADEELAAWARQEVAAWPPLTGAQRELIAAALGGAAGPSG